MGASIILIMVAVAAINSVMILFALVPALITRSIVSGAISLLISAWLFVALYMGLALAEQWKPSGARVGALFGALLVDYALILAGRWLYLKKRRPVAES